MRAGAVANPALRSAVHDLGYARRFSADQARDILGWKPRPSRDAVVAAGRSMVDQGLVSA